MRDECFIRGTVPMTKSEVRAVSLSKLEIGPASVVYDIGAGTGSVAVEAAMAARDGHVYAFDRDLQACALIEKNREKFCIGNLTVVPGTVPQTLEDDALPAPDCVFVGGSGGKMEAVLDLVFQKNPAARIVLNVVTLESQARIFAYLMERGLEAELVTVQVSRAGKLGNYHRMEAQNPVTVITVDPAQNREDLS